MAVLRLWPQYEDTIQQFFAPVKGFCFEMSSFFANVCNRLHERCRLLTCLRLHADYGQGTKRTARR